MTDKNRRHLGSPSGGLVLIEVYGGRVGDIVVRSSVMDTDEYVKMMLSSKYCLVLRGSSHTNNVRLYDVMLHGCIPVCVSTYNSHVSFCTSLGTVCFFCAVS